MGGTLFTRTLVAVAVLALLLLPRHESVRAASLLQNGDFEAGTAGWVASTGAVLTTETHASAPAGPTVGRVTAQPGAVALRTQYWLADASAGAEYAGAAWTLAEQAVRSLALRVEFLSDAGAVIERTDDAAFPAAEGIFAEVVTAPAPAPAGTRYVRLAIVADAEATGATFLVDGAVLEEVAPPPAITPTVQPSPTATAPAATPSPTGTARPTSTPRPTATPRSNTTTTPVPPSPPAAALRNATFEEGTEEWDVQRGTLTTRGAIGAAFGESLVLEAAGGTAWAQQLCAVTPGQWYDASAILAPLENVGAAWVRIAWYASPLGEGAQLSTDDSASIASPASNAQSATYSMAATGAVQAPAGAQSARVRVLLQPRAAGLAALAIDNVAFRETSPPPLPSPTPAPTMAPTAEAPSATAPSPAPTAAPPSSRGSSAPPASTPGPLLLLRITEVMPNPEQGGRDADYEWLELTNLGRTAASLDGVSLRDNEGTTALPATEVPPGASIVIAAPLAVVDADVRLAGAIGNGLGNEGDVLLLLDASGAILDAVAYGDAAPPAGVPLLPAPGAGESLARAFDAAGALIQGAVGPPSPGIAVQPIGTETPAPSSPASPATDATGEGDAPARDDGAAEGPWTLLIAIAGGALGGAVIHRVGAKRRR